MLSALALAFGLSMDSTAVCAARAFGGRDHREQIILPVLFAIVQTAMAALGWLGGRELGHHVGAYDRWIAFGLLTVIGGKMVVEALRDHAEPPAPGSPLLYLGLALATSIDAGAAGLTLPMLAVEPQLALVVLAIVTAVLCATGYAIGRALGQKVGPKLGAVGGIVLIGMGIDILIRAA